MGRLTILFIGIFVACLLGYLSVYALMLSMPQSAVAFAIFLLPLGIGMLVGVVGAVASFVLNK